MIDAKEFLKAGQLLQGHRCPAMPLGLRAGAAAMNALAVARARDQELLAVLELGENHCAHCFGDGVQVVTGCTFGKGNLRTTGHGKFSVTLIDRATGRSVRVTPRVEAHAGMMQSSFFREFRAKGIPASRIPDEVVDPLIKRIMNAPEAQLVLVGAEVRVPIEPRADALDTGVCEVCGEPVVDRYLRVAGGLMVCIPCQERTGVGTGRDRLAVGPARP